jgi:hypothetical protein
MPRRLLGLSDIARELGTTIQVVSNWHARANGRLPKPSYLGPNEAPLWTRQALERAGVLTRPDQEESL